MTTIHKLVLNKFLIGVAQEFVIPENSKILSTQLATMFRSDMTHKRTPTS